MHICVSRPNKLFLLAIAVRKVDFLRPTLFLPRFWWLCANAAIELQGYRELKIKQMSDYFLCITHKTVSAISSIVVLLEFAAFWFWFLAGDGGGHVPIDRPRAKRSACTRKCSPMVYGNNRLCEHYAITHTHTHTTIHDGVKAGHAIGPIGPSAECLSSGHLWKRIQMIETDPTATEHQLAYGPRRPNRSRGSPLSTFVPHKHIIRGSRFIIISGYGRAILQRDWTGHCWPWPHTPHKSHQRASQAEAAIWL